MELFFGEGNYLLPGLIELHTNNLEKCIFSSRPGVRWHLEVAVNHDRDLISIEVISYLLN